MAYESSLVDEGWPKWKVALAIGAPVALGAAGVWLYRRRLSSSAAVKSRTSERVVVEETTKIPQACCLVIVVHHPHMHNVLRLVLFPVRTHGT